jgi:hypothetical protein
MDNEGNGSCVLEGTSSADPAGYKMDDEVVDSAEPALKRKVVDSAEPALKRKVVDSAEPALKRKVVEGVRHTRPCDGQSPKVLEASRSE